VTKAKAVKILNRDYDGTILCRDILHKIPNPDCDILDGVDYLNDLLIALLTAIDALEQDNGWISVKDRMPEDDVSILICSKRKTISKATYSSSMERYNIADSDYWYNELDVTHWMQLPEPPATFIRHRKQ
jgi:hypothetical protein